MRPKHRKTLTVLTVLFLLLGIRIALPYGIEWYVNRVLDQDPDYDGEIQDVDLVLIKGQYSIQGVRIVRTDGDSPVPLFESPRVDISLQWSALLKGAVVGQIDVWKPELYFAVTEGGGMQDGSEADWQSIVLDLTPVQINRLGVHDGTVHYVDTFATPRVDLYLRSVQAEARNLTNAEDLSGTMVADFDATAVVMDSGRLELNGVLDPYAVDPTFDFDLAIRELDLVEVNPWLQAYAKFDVNEGTMHAYAELHSSEGNYRGYLKPLLRNIDVVDSSDVKGGPLELAWEATVGMVKGLLSNGEDEQVATVAPIKGRYDDPKLGVWRTIVEGLKNAFVEVLTPGFEGIPIGGPKQKADRNGDGVVSDQEEKLADIEKEHRSDREEAQRDYEKALEKAGEQPEDEAAELRRDAEEKRIEKLAEADAKRAKKHAELEFETTN